MKVVKSKLGGSTLIEKNIILPDQLTLNGEKIKEIVIGVDWGHQNDGYIPVSANATVQTDSNKIFNFLKLFECSFVDGKDWHPNSEPAPFRLSKWEGKIEKTYLPDELKTVFNQLLDEVPEPDDDNPYPISVLYVKIN